MIRRFLFCFHAREGYSFFWHVALVAGPVFFLILGLARADDLDAELARLRVEVCTTHYGGTPKVDRACVRELTPPPSPKRKEQRK